MSADVLSIEVEQEDAAVRVILRGELDLSNANMLSEALEEHRPAGGRISIDLSELTFMDSSGLRILLMADAAARAEGHTLRIAAPSRAVRRVFEVAGVLGELDVEDSVT